MNITGEQLLEVFANYNFQMWPMQILAYMLGILALSLIFRKYKWGTRVISTILASFWIWVALMFWLPSGLQGFSMAYAFIFLFMIEGVLILIQALRPGFSFGSTSKTHTIIGLVMVSYAMVGYPLFGLLIGRDLPQTPPFALTPCPLVLFSLGMFLLTESKVPLSLILTPFIYGLTGVIWVSIGIWEDTGLVLGSLAFGYLVFKRYWGAKNHKSETKSKNNLSAWSLDISEKKQK